MNNKYIMCRKVVNYYKTSQFHHIKLNIQFCVYFVNLKYVDRELKCTINFQLIELLKQCNVMF